MTSTLGAAEKAVAQLSEQELAQFRQWFAHDSGDHWDAQIEAYATVGKLDSLAQKTIAEYHAGKATEI